MNLTVPLRFVNPFFFGESNFFQRIFSIRKVMLNFKEHFALAARSAGPRGDKWGYYSNGRISQCFFFKKMHFSINS
ncbi:hypothetical protein C4J81_08365 [Deltaproteobacteria bacterium Smac51]|nr:hypothetical protein C4J81_08365 [Deltaproteobacteria bacterium Smac51]